MSSMKDRLDKIRNKRSISGIEKRAKEKPGMGNVKQLEPLYIDEIKNVIAANSIKGEFKFRILPPFHDSIDGHWGYPIETHYDVGINKKMFHCPKRMTQGKSPCPICYEVEKYEEFEDRQKNKHFYPSFGLLVYVIDRDNEDKGVQLWRMPPEKVAQEILIQAAKYKIKSVDHEGKGFDVSANYVKKDGEKWGTWSGVTIDRDVTPLSDDEELMDEWLLFVNNYPLDKIYILHPFETLKEALDGQEVLEDKIEKPTQFKTFFKDKTNIPDEVIKSKFKKFR